MSRGGRQPGDPCDWPSIDGGICEGQPGPDGRCLAHRSDLPARVKDWPETWRYLFEERAGIMEFEAGMTRQEAERRAEQVLREEFRQ